QIRPVDSGKNIATLNTRIRSRRIRQNILYVTKYLIGILIQIYQTIVDSECGIDSRKLVFQIVVIIYNPRKTVSRSVIVKQIVEQFIGLHGIQKLVVFGIG